MNIDMARDIVDSMYGDFDWYGGKFSALDIKNFKILLKELVKVVGVVLVTVHIGFTDPSTTGTEPPSAGWNFGNVTYAQESGSLVLNSLSDNYGISQFNTANTNGQAAQNLGNNDYIPENAVKNMLAIDGYSQAYDYNPQYSGLYASAYNQPLPTNVPLTELSFMGLAGNPNAIQNVYVPTSQYNTLSVQGVNGMLDPTTVLNQTVNGNTVAIAQETVRAETVETGLATGLNQADAQINANTSNIANVATGLGNETQARIGADNALQGQIDATNANVGQLQNQVNDMERLKVMPEGAVRFYDDRHMSAMVYDDYDATNGRNYAIGVKVMLKIGKSYEETQIDSLKTEIADLKEMLYAPNKE
jgi:hypothetical protein